MRSTRACAGGRPLRVDYGLLYRQRYPILRRACKRPPGRSRPGYAAFCERRTPSGWRTTLSSWPSRRGPRRRALAGLGGTPAQPRPRDPGQVHRGLGADIDFWKAVQYLFFRQWRALKDYANARGVGIIGDLPIYVSGDSVDVWAHPEQFQLDENLLPTEVAGCPPDGFSAGGSGATPLF